MISSSISHLFTKEPPFISKRLRPEVQNFSKNQLSRRRTQLYKLNRWFLHGVTTWSEPSSDHCYPQIFLIPFFQRENPVINVTASLLQILSALSVIV